VSQSTRGGQFATSAGDPEFASLVQNGDGSYTRTSKDGQRREFNSAGWLTSRTQRQWRRTDYNDIDVDGEKRSWMKSRRSSIFWP
jgi:hypothetical protein